MLLLVLRWRRRRRLLATDTSQTGYPLQKAFPRLGWRRRGAGRLAARSQRQRHISTGLLMIHWGGLRVPTVESSIYHYPSCRHVSIGGSKKRIPKWIRRTKYSLYNYILGFPNKRISISVELWGVRVARKADSSHGIRTKENATCLGESNRVIGFISLQS